MFLFFRVGQKILRFMLPTEQQTYKCCNNKYSEGRFVLCLWFAGWNHLRSWSALKNGDGAVIELQRLLNPISLDFSIHQASHTYFRLLSSLILPDKLLAGIKNLTGVWAVFSSFFLFFLGEEKTLLHESWVWDDCNLGNVPILRNLGINNREAGVV